MEYSIESNGKTIDEAIQNALTQLNMEREDVSVEILEKPKTGFLGLGGTQAKVKVTYAVSKADMAVRFLEGLIQRMKADAYISAGTEKDGVLPVELKGPDAASLIGRRGDILDAMQHLATYAANRDSIDTPLRVQIDAEGYRAKRTETLVRLAKKMAGNVVKYRRSMSLEPMNSFERHIIHTALTGYPDVKTQSVGHEPNRRVMINYLHHDSRKK